MYKVVLLNLPVSNMNMPSIALTQLKSVLDEQFGGRVTTEIWYLNHDFVRYLGSESTLKLMKNGTTAFQNLRLLKYCVTHEVFPIWNILIGFPGEEEEVYQKYLHDLPMLAHLPPPSAPFLVRFDRYSPYFALAQEYGLDLVPFAFYRFAYPWSEESLQNLAYHFEDQNPLADYSVIAHKWLGKLEEQVHQWNRAWLPAGAMRTAPAGEVWMARDKRYQPNLPKLLLKTEGDETLIHDSRSGKELRYPIGETTKQILQYLDQPHKKADLSANFAHLAPLAIEQEMVYLKERGLLFEEDDRFLSLVLPGKPSASSPAVAAEFASASPQ